jgi:PAS domain S-box-containing protein
MERRGQAPTDSYDGPTSPLSSRDQAALKRARGTRLPLVFVLLSLAFAVVLPQLSQRRVRTLRDEINLYADPARQQLTAIQLYLTRGVTQRRAYAVTRDDRLMRLYETSRRRRYDAEQALVRAVRMLDGGRAGLLTVHALRLRQLDFELDSSFTLDAPRPLNKAQFHDWRARSGRIQALSDTLADAIDSATLVRHRAVADIEMIATILTAILVLFGLGAALLVAQLGTRYRNLAIRLDEQQARFRQIAENLSDVVWLSEPNFQRHLYMNPAYERLWGRTRESFKTNPGTFMEGVHIDDRERVAATLAAMADAPTDVEFRIVRPNGELRWAWSRSFPVRGADGKVFRIAGIIEDITEERRHAAERERLLERERAAREIAERREKDLEVVTESRVRLLRGFTHDVKNPLGIADGYLALLEEGVLGPVPGKQQETVNAARQSIHHALELIHKLLDLARAEAGQLELHTESTDLTAVVREVADSFKPQAQTKAIELALNLPDHGASLVTDPARLRQVVGNLVSNAVKYTPRGGHVRVEVCMPAGRSNGKRQFADIRIADDGPGIQPEKLSQLFIEFSRFDATAAEGAGIGLAISQKIAQALGGSISVENHTDRGCTFTLHLPFD